MTLKVGSEVTQGHRNRHVSIRQYSTIVIIGLSMFQAGIVVRPTEVIPIRRDQLAAASKPMRHSTLSDVARRYGYSK